MENIESMYGTSMGSIIAVMFSLKYDWETMDDYLIKRPWHQLVKYDIHTIFSAFTNRGIFDINVIKETFQPLFSGMDIPIEVTLQEFYEITKIELHIFTTSVNDFRLVDLSHKTHPSWTVVEAVYASSCLPIIFTPFSKEGEFYVDGGVFLNYPLKPCTEDYPNLDEILGVRKTYVASSGDAINETSNLMDYVLVLLNKTLKIVSRNVEPITIKHEIAVQSSSISIVDFINMISLEDFRVQKINQGVEEAAEQCKRLIQDGVDEFD
jgi:NTE family protein